MEARIIRTPILQNRHQSAFLNQILDLRFKGKGNACTVECGLHRQILLADAELSVNFDG